MKEIKKYLDEEREGTYSFVFEDLDGEYVYKYNEDKQMTSAGVMKLIFGVAFLKRVEAGDFSMDEFISIKEEDKKPGSGILREFIERNYTVRELVTVMLVEGDNTATFKLMKLMGREKINETFEEMGLKNTVLSGDPGVKENLTTASDLARVIRILYEHSFLSKKNSDFVTDLLRQRVKSRIAFYLDIKERYKFASKTGNSDGIEHEVALINAPTGNYVLAIMSSGIPNSVYGIITLAKAGMMVWDSINANFRSEGN